MANAYNVDPNLITYIAGKVRAEIASEFGERFPLSVVNGGTGATDGPAAFASLGAAAYTQEYSGKTINYASTNWYCRIFKLSNGARIAFGNGVVSENTGTMTMAGTGSVTYNRLPHPADVIDDVTIAESRFFCAATNLDYATISDKYITTAEYKKSDDSVRVLWNTTFSSAQNRRIGFVYIAYPS